MYTEEYIYPAFFGVKSYYIIFRVIFVFVWAKVYAQLTLNNIVLINVQKYNNLYKHLFIILYIVVGGRYIFDKYSPITIRVTAYNGAKNTMKIMFILSLSLSLIY